MRRGLKKRIAFGLGLGLDEREAGTLAELHTPEAIQDFITRLSMNPEKDGDTCHSVKNVLKFRHAHCIEAAMLAAAALWMGGAKPLLMDMRAQGDDDHVITLFRVKGCWGAISKSNHVWLRWRDPVYRTLRELAMSYFHEYTNKEKKTLRAYSASFDLRRYAPDAWVTNPDNCWDIAVALDDARHYRLLTPSQVRALKPRDNFELKANKMLQYQA